MRNSLIKNLLIYLESFLRNQLIENTPITITWIISTHLLVSLDATVNIFCRQACKLL